PVLFSTSKSIYFQTWPGWAHGKYDVHAKYGEDDILADMLPLDSSFEGYMKKPMAFYKNRYNGLVGISPFIDGTPQHAFCTGINGSGKSHFLRDLVSQCAAYLSRLVVIEEGGSFEPVTNSLGSKMITIEADGDYTFNPFDTMGIPLSQEILLYIATLFSKKFGKIQDEGEQMMIKSYIGEYVVRLFHDYYQSKTRYNHDLEYEISKEAYVAFQYT
ncbi:MAG: hypothetical protein V4507_10850, partial [Verrucomicrobiota bacterium]